jgi:hypothetical protein
MHLFDDHAPAAAPTANIVRREGIYHLFMLVDGQWLDTGLSASRLQDLTEIADREFTRVLINAPMAQTSVARAA